MILHLTTRCVVDLEQCLKNAAASEALGLPSVKEAGRSGPLAVIGGGTSIREHVETLRNWPGDVWAINGALRWCRSHGIDATLLMVDPEAWLSEFAAGAKRAVVAACCDPAVFRALLDQGTSIHRIWLEGFRGSSAATSAPSLAIWAGYQSVTLFGCESSFQPGGGSHAYRRGVDQAHRCHMMTLRVGAREYLTRAQFYVQAIELAAMLRVFPEHLHERSGGLLRAMIGSDDHEVLWVSDDMRSAA